MLISPELQQELRTQYNPDGSDLRRAQLRMVEMLKFIDEFCTKHNITYWLDYGTLLGAARHGGFIPWDDDTDIAMPIEDMVRFKKLMLKENSSNNYVIHCLETDKEYYSINWICLKDLNSKYEMPETAEFHHVLKYQGLQVDIFGVEKHVSVRIKKIISSFFFTFIFRPGNFHKLHHRILHPFRPFSRFILNNLLLPLCRIYRSKNNKDTYTCYGLPWDKFRSQNDIFPIKRISFEGIGLNVPNNVDNYLTNLYGDWQKIPNLDERRVHSNRISFLYNSGKN